MFKVSSFTKYLVALSMVSPAIAGAQTKKVERPPQYVLFAFDGSYTNSVWQYSRDFSKDQQQNRNADVKFTYFINPVYLLYKDTTGAADSRRFYRAPAPYKGSAIGFGDSKEDVSERVDQMNDAYLEGHEIGSHAVGHFDGSVWSEEAWTAEFTEFYTILDNVFKFNGLRPTSKQNRGLLFRNEIYGFRAPLLGFSKGMWPVLPKFGIRYDTSLKNNENYWPTRNKFGTWDFPLAQIKEPNGARTWVSMDYNFCVRDTASLRKANPATDRLGANKPGIDCYKTVTAEQKAQVKKNMLNLYRTYFARNYYGNRAPVHIGHHFSNWMSGAYMEVFYEFANEVCSKPEVRCGTYTSLMNFVESKSAKEIAAYQAGAFDKMPAPKSMKIDRHWDLAIAMKADDQKMNFELKGADAQRPGLKQIITVNGKNTEIKGEITLENIRKMGAYGEDTKVRIAVEDRLGKEVQTATFKVEGLGTDKEKISSENIEEKWNDGHLAGAHDEENDTHGH
ncbi:polysaccharide deacetylase family protein [Bdellovibrio reynosensis]|uniref:Polysaccharide deacetylase n=1 Tax=Bdellovibrio reynosensis TaxID=2835041 RepID=A0ABY4CD05_9BACT|nr:hypothetical protein [Bdellovibrio reynosensis]UOF02840.1 hypothetical protein MNR06_07725 [Bdellovibrio reynosensis]